MTMTTISIKSRLHGEMLESKTDGMNIEDLKGSSCEN